jgi:O-antigen/teichoic acid export membrane protein
MQPFGNSPVPPTTKSSRVDNTRTITKNSFWYTVGAAATTLTMLGASIPVARIMGPHVLGHYVFLVFLTTIAQRLANVGLPATTCKYMAEYLGASELELAHGVYRLTMRYQAIVAAVVTAVGCVIVQFWSESGYKTVSFLMVISIWPSMIDSIAAQANLASENALGNLPASFANMISYGLLIAATLVFNWGLVGLATATLVSRSMEAAWRFAGVQRWLGRSPARPVPHALHRRMLVFSRQNIVLLALGLVVWDRSELLFLNHYWDAREIAYYSVAFTVVRQLLTLPIAFSSAVGYTIFAQYGREPARLAGLALNATRYVALFAFPLFLGVAAVAQPLILVTYGPTYRPMIAVLWVLSVFAIPRAFQVHSESLLQATEAQAFMVKWLAVTAVVNLSLDWLLIPRYGAVGAAFANGIAQTVAVAGVWIKAASIVRISLPWGYLARVALAAFTMLAMVLPTSKALSPVLGLLLGIPLGVVVFGVLVRLTGILDVTDAVRLEGLSRRLPDRLRGILQLAVRLLAARPAPLGQTA